MLFGYPVEATENNWLHDCICEAIRTIHAAIDAGNGYPGWPTVLPETARVALKSRTGLRSRLSAYDIAVRLLAEGERDLLLDAMEGQNRIADLLSGRFDCLMLEDTPEALQTAVSELFGFAFGLLAELGVRDQQYRAIYAATDDHVCPFCGTEQFDAPGAPREDLDHYLARTHYAFAAANLRNLVPMGQKCNSRYKLARNLLRRDDGARRVAFDPYMQVPLSVSLDGSEPFGGTKENTPAWDIQFLPDSPAVATWDDVFSIRERYRRDNLDPNFPKWLALFATWVRSQGIPTDTDEELVTALNRYAENWAQGGMQDRAFLKAAVFRMLGRRCEDGHDRLKAQLRDLVSPPAVFSADVA